VSSPWDEPGWLDGAIAWVDERVERVGEVEVERMRPWSAIARVPTTDGVVWFKENSPANAFEPELTALLAQRRPDALPEVVARDGPRLVTRHVGPRLREVLDAGGAEPSWEEVLALYGEVQIELTPLVGDALAAGTPDERPSLLPELYEELVGRGGAYDAVRRATDALGDAVPPTVVHQEAHDGNVFVRDGRPVFIDWAEASVSHPFLGTLLPLRSAAERAGFAPGSREVARLRDVYLEPFSRFAPLPELREAFGHAYLLAPIGRAHVWRRTLAPLPEAVSAEHGEPVAAWLEILRGIESGAITLGGA
jgi:Phosphotransferase enzyme family